MIITVLDGEFSVCQVHSLKHIDFTDDFIFVGKTDRELSLVCRTAAAPDDAPAREDGWKAFRIEGTLDFSQVGVLAELSGLLARCGISIFAVSTYATDYILVKREKLAEALAALKRAGHESA
ncbi:MAG: ACT domain-containing protein [Desulfovibrio sp.]|uniref:ACT domain-containing protein n=1 Tax=Desulfovibrio porci TaxID=2605782 RepID=A0A6L5XPB1_9BACT|nr:MULTISPECIES: ACT domain-containing protein [Desulfovibrio]MCD7984179.1 ACT domain-containing protein [Desulfovibrio sp.]MDY3810926.1 ACT domain-containing protein [Desulfovibrio porci]MSS28962.1 ACT domain-containing protein [Desulfovibrio porci]